MNATRAAVEEGIVAGGGVALLRCQSVLEKLDVPPTRRPPRVDIVARALEAPARWIAQNGGVDGAVVDHAIKSTKGDHGHNAASGKYENLVEAGVMDPTKVVRTALQNAASVAGLLITTEALVAQKPKKKAKAAGGGGMGGGMGGDDFDDMDY